MFYVYVLRSEFASGLCIGYSSDRRARLAAQQEGAERATSNRGPWTLIYYEAFLERKDALDREKYLKSAAGRRFLQTQLRHYLRKHPLVKA
jgi:putative endonuclease